jgi:hypothetical protein
MSSSKQLPQRLQDAKQCEIFVDAGGALGGATTKNYNLVTF